MKALGVLVTVGILAACAASPPASNPPVPPVVRPSAEDDDLAAIGEADDGDDAPTPAAAPPAEGAEKDPCEREPFDGITIVGSFVHDRGCRFMKLIVAGTDHATVEEATPKGLAHLGWAQSDAKKKEELALAWTDKVLGYAQVFDVVHVDDAAHKPLYSPKVTVKDGAATVELWRDTTVVGMRPTLTRDYVETVITYDATGNLASFENKRRHSEKK